MALEMEDLGQAMEKNMNITKNMHEGIDFIMNMLYDLPKSHYRKTLPVVEANEEELTVLKKRITRLEEMHLIENPIPEKHRPSVEDLQKEIDKITERLDEWDGVDQQHENEE
ncbi:MAG: hypothetical protein LBR15_02610, partial [Methanobrevibacter sp.]|nr:hypothetical protein [Candidatus Methanovirga australis]